MTELVQLSLGFVCTVVGLEYLEAPRGAFRGRGLALVAGGAVLMVAATVTLVVVPF